MIKKLMMYFAINKSLQANLRAAEQMFHQAEGEIKTLKEWLNDVKEENKNLKDIIYKKVGLTRSSDEQSMGQVYQRIPVRRTFPDVKRELESLSKEKPLDPVLQAQQDHWKEKMKENLEEEQKTQ